MAPTHSKPVLDEKKRSAKKANRAMASLIKHPIQKLQDGDAVFNDDFVNAVAEGKHCRLKGGLDAILDEKKPKGLPKDDRKHSPFQKCEDAECHSDGELVKPIKDDSFFEEEEEDEDGENKEPFLTQLSEATPQKKDGLVQAEGFNLDDCMAEEEPVNPNACPDCLRYPCILDDPAAIEEGHEIVNELLMDRIEGLEVNDNNFRYALCRMCARHLRFCDRTMLPRCVYQFINKHFKEEDEPSTGFRERNA